MTSPYISNSLDFFPDMSFIGILTNATTTNPVQVTIPNHGLTTGNEIYIYHVDGMTELNIGDGENSYTVTVIDENTVTLDGVDGSGFSAYTGSGEAYFRPFYRTKTWKRVFGGGIGFQHRIKFISSGIDRPFRIHAFKPCFKPIGKRNIN